MLEYVCLCLKPGRTRVRPAVNPGICDGVETVGHKMIRRSVDWDGRRAKNIKVRLRFPSFNMQ